MSKRQAVEPLEDVLDAPSPGPKRARVEDVDMDESRANGAPSNGRLMSPRLEDREEIDIPDADARSTRSYGKMVRWTISMKKSQQWLRQNDKMCLKLHTPTCTSTQ